LIRITFDIRRSRLKKTTAIVLVFLALIIGFVVRDRYVKQHQFQSPTEFAQWLATDAVQDAKDNNHVALDYTPASIQNVEKILGQLHDQYAKNPSSISANGLASAYGAYIGEVIRRSEPDVKWERDDPVGGEKSYPLIWGSLRTYPMAWCYHRIENGPEDDVWFKYRALKDERDKKRGKGATNP
jgi:hypothetical protein